MLPACHNWLYAVLGLEPRTLCVLGQHSTDRAMLSYPTPHPDMALPLSSTPSPFSVLTPYSLPSPMLSLALVPNTEQKPPLADDEAHGSLTSHPGVAAG